MLICGAGKRVLIVLALVALAALPSSCRSTPPQANTVAGSAAPAQPGTPAKLASGAAVPAVPASKAVTEQDVFNYLLAQVPEIAAYRREIDDYNQANRTNFRFIMRIDGDPDPGAADSLLRDYYSVYVGEDAGDHTNRWATFYVEKDLQGIMVEDILTGGQVSLTAWRQQMKD